MANGRGHQLAKSALESSHYYCKGDFTWTVAVAISGPSQHQRVVIAIKKVSLHGQWPWSGQPAWSAK